MTLYVKLFIHSMWPHPLPLRKNNLINFKSSFSPETRCIATEHSSKLLTAEFETKEIRGTTCLI